MTIKKKNRQFESIDFYSKEWGNANRLIFASSNQPPARSLNPARRKRREIIKITLVEAGHVYIISPGRFITNQSGELKVQAPNQKCGHRTPINLFFSKLDLVSCRNLLIYLTTAVQERIIPLLHFVLRQNGFLVLGSSENINKQHSSFEMISKPRHVQSINIVEPVPM